MAMTGTRRWQTPKPMALRLPLVHLRFDAKLRPPVPQRMGLASGPNGLPMGKTSPALKGSVSERHDR
jgi:hypothetical protein